MLILELDCAEFFSLKLIYKIDCQDISRLITHTNRTNLIIGFTVHNLDLDPYNTPVTLNRNKLIVVLNVNGSDHKNVIACQ